MSASREMGRRVFRRVGRIRQIGLGAALREAQDAVRRRLLDLGYGRQALEQESRFAGVPPPVVEVAEAGPRVSLVTPALDTPPGLLEACAASVLRQTDPRWEWLVVDDGGRSPVSQRLPADARIRIIRRDASGGIGVATAAGAAGARGKWIVLLDHDDLLAPDAVEAVVGADGDLLYSDEDKVSAGGRYIEPFHKPGPSRVLIESTNYAGHLLALRRALWERIGGMRAGYDGAQDYDLVLRALGAGARFVHLPRCLYHWRQAAGSTSVDVAAKPYASVAGRKALEEHLGLPVDEVSPCRYRPRRRLAGPVGVLLAAMGGRSTPVPPPGDAEGLVCEGVDLGGAPRDQRLVLAAAQALDRGCACVITLPPMAGWPQAETIRVWLGWLAVGSAAGGRILSASGRRVLVGGMNRLADGGLCFPGRGFHPAEGGYFGLGVCPQEVDALPVEHLVARAEGLLAAAGAGRGRAGLDVDLAVGQALAREGRPPVLVPGSDLRARWDLPPLCPASVGPGEVLRVGGRVPPGRRFLVGAGG